MTATSSAATSGTAIVPEVSPVAGAVASAQLGPPRPALDQQWARLGRIALIAAGAQIFIALAGMPVALDERMIVSPVLSLGYAALVWIPLVAGYRAGHQAKTPTSTVHAAGAHELVGGALAGAAAGLGLSILGVLIANFDLRDPLVNWSPQLADLLGFGRGTTFGVVAWLVLGTVLGLAGAAMRLLGSVVRRAVLAMAVGVAVGAVLEQIVSELIEGLGGEAIADWLYQQAKRAHRGWSCGGGAGGGSVHHRGPGPGAAGEGRG